MITSYFFVPGSKLHKLQDILRLNIDQVIIDLEDAVKESEMAEIVSQLKESKIYQNYYIRIPIYTEDRIDLSLIEILLAQGYKNFVLPKIKSFKDYEQIQSFLKNHQLNLILLIERIRFLEELKEAIDTYPNGVKGLAVGSHDLMNEVGGSHTLDNLYYARTKILYLAKMNNVLAIDIASMELKDETQFSQEIEDGIIKGFDAKFFIHPWQIRIFNTQKYYSEKDYQWALKVYKALEEVGSEEEFNPIILDGHIIEKPHLALAKKILKNYEGKQPR